MASALFAFSGGAPGYYSIVFLTFLAVLLSMFRQAYLQRGFGAALMCVAICLVVYELANFAMALFFGLAAPSYVTVPLISAGLSLVSVPALYPVCLLIESIGGETWRE